MATAVSVFPEVNDRASTGRLKRNAQRRRAATPTDEQRAHAHSLLSTEIHFVPSQAFRAKDAAKTILSAPCSLTAKPGARKPESAHARVWPIPMGRLCNADPLAVDEERNCFRRMNYLKYRANALRTSIDVDRLDVDALDTAEGLLREAREIRDRILLANMRLVVSIVRKLVPSPQLFDELFSDAILALVRAVDHFDYGRGFRFSTYAYHSVARTVRRLIYSRIKESARCISLPNNVLDPENTRNEDTATTERDWQVQRQILSHLLSQLNPRERFIIAARFGLASREGGRTFQSLGDSLGISKERVRQLELQALTKLRAMTQDLPPEAWELLA